MRVENNNFILLCVYLMVNVEVECFVIIERVYRCVVIEFVEKGLV